MVCSFQIFQLKFCMLPTCPTHLVFDFIAIIFGEEHKLTKEL